MPLTDLAWIDSAGYHCADFPSFLTYFKSAYQGIYGTDTYLEPDSQDGQWLAVLSQAHYDSAQRGQATYNSFKPQDAQGVGLSRLVKLNGLRRDIPTNSTVELTLGGTVGTPLQGRIAVDNQNQQWLIPNCVIGGGGTVTVTATAADVGAVLAPAGTVTGLFNPTRGWQTVTNPFDATPGAPVETDGQLRQRQAVSTAQPALTVIAATASALNNLTGVQKVRPYENTSETTDGNGLPPHSVDFVVLGSTDAAIAALIQKYKTPGGVTYGNTGITVYDSQGMPVTIHFDRPITATIAVNIIVKAGTGWSNDYIPLIQAALASAISSGQIGATIKLNSLFTPAELLGTSAAGTFDISSIQLNKNGGAFGAANVTLAYNENPVCLAASVNVTVT